jgi:phospholipid/cholesterol/gamma-HCH transport system ATP-binding protein
LHSTDNKPIIIVENATVSFDDNTILENVSFQVQKGEILVIVGESGCGKTTLLKVMIGLQKTTSGKVLFGGTDIMTAGDKELNNYHQNIGVLFQSSALFSSMTIGENIILPLQEYTDIAADTIDLIVKMKLGMVNLAGYENHSPVELSGGMKKRAGIARAMALDPQVLFFDELSAGLDPVTAAELDDLIIKTNEALGTTMVVVSHELQSINKIADRVIMLSKSSKGIIAEGTPDDLREKATDPQVRSFFWRRATDHHHQDRSYVR